MTAIFSHYANLPLWELTAVLLSVAYVVLAANNNRWCWPAAFLSTLIFAVIFYDVQLLMDSALQVYYLVMAVYGWWCWQQGKQSEDSSLRVEPDSKISTRTLSYHLSSIGVLTVVSLVWGWFMANYTPASFPYVDTFTTVFAVFATYLVTQRVLENWLYWIVIDFISIYLYIAKSLMPTAVLFALFVVIAIFGYVKWLKIYRASNGQRVNAKYASS